MERVTGIGGVFFKSKDPEALKRWYVDHLGVQPDEQGYVSFHWREHADPDVEAFTAWGPFSETTDYFDPSSRPFMVNYRVRNLERMLAQLRAAGADVDDRVEEYEYGKFGWVMDPDGTRIELWEPPAPAS